MNTAESNFSMCFWFESKPPTTNSKLHSKVGYVAMSGSSLPLYFLLKRFITCDCSSSMSRKGWESYRICLLTKSKMGKSMSIVRY